MRIEFLMPARLKDCFILQFWGRGVAPWKIEVGVKKMVQGIIPNSQYFSKSNFEYVPFWKKDLALGLQNSDKIHKD